MKLRNKLFEEKLNKLHKSSNNQNENKEDTKASEKNVNSYPEHSKQLEEWLKDVDWSTYDDEGTRSGDNVWNWN